MATEIERKFRVQGDGWRQGAGTHYRQGYLSRDPDRTVRVRLAGEHAWLTIKGRTIGLARPEFEYPIPLADGEALLQLCDGPLVEKIRRRIDYRGMVWEVDEFFGANAGLVLAEIELSHPDQTFDAPPWLAEEVSADPRFFNANLSLRPYRGERDATLDGASADRSRPTEPSV